MRRPAPVTGAPFQWPAAGTSLRGYRLAGESPVGVFVHGFRSHCDGAKAVSLAAHAARRGRSWIRYNQRFCAPPRSDFRRFTVGQSVEDLLSLLHFLRQPALLVGSSLGALISLQAALRAPELVRGMLLIAPAVRFVERHFASLPAAVLEQWRRRGALEFPDPYEGGQFSLDHGFYLDAVNYARPGPWDFDFPVSIVHGESDELLPATDSRDLAGAIRSPSVTLDVVPGGDHRLIDAIPLMCRRLDDLWLAT